MLRKIREIYNRSKFSRNTAPKMLSIIFAVTFWIFVMDQVNPEMTRQIENVQVELIGVQELEAKGYEIMGERDFNVDVTVKGRRNEVLNISKSDIQVEADLGDLENGLQIVRLDHKVEVADIIIEKISSDTVKIDIDAVIRKPIDVHIERIGSVPSEYQTEEMSLSPQQVFVSGPESYVALVDNIRGEINITNNTTEITKDLAVVPVDENGEIVTGVEVETDYVTVNIPISKVVEVDISPQFDGNVKEGYELIDVIVSPEFVDVRGQRDDINALKFIETMPVSLAGADQSFEIYTTLDVPEDIIMNQYFDQVKLSFIIEKVITKEFTFDYSDITFINMADPLRTDINEQEGQLIIRVSAVESLINELSKNDLGLYIDAENFEVGEIDAEVQLNKNNDFSSVEIIPDTIHLNVININDQDVITEEEVITEE